MCSTSCLAERSARKQQISYLFCFGKIKQVLSSDRGNVSSFLKCLQRARNPRKLWLRWSSAGIQAVGWNPIYRKIVYHAESLSLYRNIGPGVFLLKPNGPEAADGPRRVDTSRLRLPSPVASPAGLTAVPVVLSLSTLTLSQLRSFAAWSETASVTAITESATSVVAEAPAQLLRVSAEGALEDRSMFELVEMLRMFKKTTTPKLWKTQMLHKASASHFPGPPCTPILPLVVEVFDWSSESSRASPL